MDFSERGQEHPKTALSIVSVVLIHALILFVLIAGTEKQIVSAIRVWPIETMLINEVAVKLPSTKIPPTSPKQLASTKPFVSTPAIVIQQPASINTIQALSQTQSPAPSPSTHVIEQSVQSTTGPVIAPAVVDFSTCNKPSYPQDSLRNEEQGTVQLQFLIGLDGGVVDSKIEKSSGFRLLDAAAKNALRSCRFKPGTIDGIPQQSWTIVNYVWKLP